MCSKFWFRKGLNDDRFHMSLYLSAIRKWWGSGLAWQESYVVLAGSEMLRFIFVRPIVMAMRFFLCWKRLKPTIALLAQQVLYLGALKTRNLYRKSVLISMRNRHLGLISKQTGHDQCGDTPTSFTLCWTEINQTPMWPVCRAHRSNRNRFVSKCFWTKILNMFGFVENSTQSLNKSKHVENSVRFTRFRIGKCIVGCFGDLFNLYEVSWNLVIESPKTSVTCSKKG